MNDYHFLTLWRLTAPLNEVWDALRDVDHWARWWPCVRDVRTLNAGDADGVGAVRVLTWHGALPYSLSIETRITHVDPMREVRTTATGEAEGTGVWQFDTEGSITVVRYAWDVHTKREWMNKLAPLARPLFRWNHNYVMRRGGEGLAATLNAHLVECLDTDLPPAAIGKERDPRELRHARDAHEARAHVSHEPRH